MTMAYKPIHRYDRKDDMDPGNPEKIIRGKELYKDFDAISKEFERQGSQIEGIQGEVDKFPDYVEEAPKNGTAYVRSNGAWIPVPEGGGGTGGQLVFWDGLLEKPEGISALGYTDTIDGGTF